MGSRAPHKKPKGRDTRSAKPPHPAHLNSRRQSARKGPTEQRGDRRAAQAQRGQQGAGAAGRPTKAKGRRHTERQATSPRSLKQQKAKRKKPAAQRGNRGAAQRERAASVSRQSNTAQEGQRRRPTGRHGAQRRTARAADRTAAPSARPSPPNPAGPVVLRVGAHGRGRGGGGGETEEGGATQAREAPNQTQKGGWREGEWRCSSQNQRDQSGRQAGPNRRARGGVLRRSKVGDTQRTRRSNPDPRVQGLEQGVWGAQLPRDRARGGSGRRNFAFREAKGETTRSCTSRTVVSHSETHRLAS